MPLGTINVESHSRCVGVLSLSRPGALRGISAGGQGPGAGGGGEASAYIGGCVRGRVKPGSGVRAGQIRIGEGPGQIRIGNAGGSNPKREEGRITKIKNKRDAGFYQRLFTGLFTKVFTAPSKNLGFYPGLAAPGFYLGKNLGRSPGVENGFRAPPRRCRLRQSGRKKTQSGWHTRQKGAVGPWGAGSSL